MCCEELSQDVKVLLPFVHAFSGCDTTSAIFGHGKTKLLKLLKGLYEINIYHFEIFYPIRKHLSYECWQVFYG